ncbi:MAG: hypothetical protein B6U87_01660 [Candidatus Aenigmarchaeota archaeon ex4484_52]|nr:MAG: hypothetical protein B6U87_01660 [Candidatus Aenigmarchaeota archaeon ex4484_52]
MNFSVNKKKFHKKAISPLIASVVLIVFTMTVAALLTTWVKDITEKQKEKAEISQQKINCFSSDMRVDNDFTKINNKTNPTLFSTRIENIGENIIYIDSYRLWDNDIEPDIWKITQEDTSKTAIVKNNAKKITLNISGINSSFNKIKIQTQCEGLYVVIEKPVTGWREDTTILSANVIEATKEQI